MRLRSVPIGYPFSMPITATFFPLFAMRLTSADVSASSMSFGAICSVSRWMASNLAIAERYARLDPKGAIWVLRPRGIAEVTEADVRALYR